MAGGFRQSYISRNQCLEHIAGETPLSFTFHLTCQLVSGVKHGQDHTKQLNFRVQTLFNLLIGMKKLYNTFKRKELTLERYQQFLCRAHGIKSNQAKRRRTIQNNILIVLTDRLQQIGKIVFTRHLVHKFKLNSHKIRAGRQQSQVWSSRGQKGFRELIRFIK